MATAGRGGRARIGRRRPAVAVALAVLAALGVSAIEAPTAGAGEPAPGRRYLDEVFTGVTETPDVTYGEAVNEQGQTQSLELDLFEPTGDTADDRPVIVWMHGGGFTSGNKNSPIQRRQAQAFARRGYVTASIEYRLGDGEDLTAIANATNDLRTAVRWFRANADPSGGTSDFPLGRDLRIDPDRISTGGYSAGAVSSLTAAYWEDFSGGGSNAGWSSEISSAISISGAAFGQPSSDDPPAIFFHGSQDTRVWYDNGPGGFSGVETCELARLAGLDCIFRTYPGVAHGVPTLDREPEIQALTAHFLSCRVGAETEFTDVDGRWFEDGAGFAERHRLMTGFGDGSFRGEAGMNRAQAVRLLFRYAGSPDVVAAHGLTDVPAWIEDAVRWAVDSGVMTGFGDDTFRPVDPLNRGQLTRAMHRVAGSAPIDELPAHGFTDVPAWVADDVVWVAADREGQLLAGSSIMTGFGDNTFRPLDPVTRAQAARALHRLAQPASAWSQALQTEPPAIACYRIGDP